MALKLSTAKSLNVLLLMRVRNEKEVGLNIPYCGIASQDDIYKPEYYCSLMEFRDLTLKRLQKYVQQRFFSVEDYLRGNISWHELHHVDPALCISSLCAPSYSRTDGGSLAKLACRLSASRLDEAPRVPMKLGCYGIFSFTEG